MKFIKKSNYLLEQRKTQINIQGDGEEFAENSRKQIVNTVQTFYFQDFTTISKSNSQDS
jgi:hypothetical protein